MKGKLYILLVGFLIATGFGFFHAEDPLSKTLSILERFISEKKPEKVYVSTDRPFYTPGDTIWFSSFLVNGVDHKKSDLSNVVNVELINPSQQVIQRARLFHDEISKGGDFVLDEELEEGFYTIRAYSNYMLNFPDSYFFKKSLRIVKSGQDLKQLNDEGEESFTYDRPNLRFFPEGGELVSGLYNTIGIKSTSHKGSGISLRGQIQSLDGSENINFQTYEQGLGVVSFTPDPTKDYEASVEIGEKTQVYQIPRIKQNGYVLNVVNRGKNLLVTVSCSPTLSLEGCFLVGHIRGQMFYNQNFENISSNKLVFKLPIQGLPDGIAHLTLFNPDGLPLCERLSFLEQAENTLLVDIKTQSNPYETRSKIDLVLNFKENPRDNTLAQFAVSVSEQSGFEEKSPGNNLKTWFLLNSDLEGSIVNPSQFFEGVNKQKQRFILDALMLTHGWRRFTWDDLYTEIEQNLTHDPEKGLWISGRTSLMDNPRKSKKTRTILNVIGNQMTQDVQMTGDDGTFHFGPYGFQDTIDIIVQARIPRRKDKGKSSLFAGNRFVNIQVDEFIPYIPPVGADHTMSIAAFDEISLSDYINDSKQRILYTSNAMMSRNLENVTIRAKKSIKSIDRQMNRDAFHGSRGKRLVVDSLVGEGFHTVMDLISRVSGVIVSGAYPNQEVYIRGIGSISGSNEPLFLYNNVPVEKAFIASLTSREVSFIDVLRGPETAIYGAQGGNGVIAVFSSPLRGQAERKPGIINYKLPGYYATREFYSPNYSKETGIPQIPDLRSTLFWDPNVQMSIDKEKAISFFACDNMGEYTINIEGVTDDGRIVMGRETIRVR